MNVYEGKLRLDAPKNTTYSDVEIIGIDISGSLIYSVKINNKKTYYQDSIDKKATFLFFEIINNSPLWSFSYNVVVSSRWISNSSTYTPYDIKYTIKIDTTLISDYIGTSLAFNYIMNSNYSSAPDFANTDFTNKSIIPYLDPVNPPKDFKINLYDYQKRTLAKMLQMEKNQTDYTVNYTFNIKFSDVDILFDPVSKIKTDTEHYFKITTKGGVLSDEMGLGKTISSIALIASHPATALANMKLSEITNYNKICSKATVILCPSHLTKQWESEILRCNPKLKVLTILTKNDYNNLRFKHFIESDIIITSHQFIMNFKFYPTLHYQPCTATSYDFNHRNEIIKKFLQDKVTSLGFPGIGELEDPIFEFFYFHRLILDEGHEIFGEMLGNASTSRYMARWVTNIDANYFWYVSGTPFVNYTGIRNCANFINLKLEDIDRDITYNFSNTSSTNTTSYNDLMRQFINKEYIWNNILDKVCIRHRKTDVENQIQIPGYQEKLVWLKFTDLEKQLYDAKKGKVTYQYLQQLCCHPLVVESSKKIFGDVEVDLSVMQDKLIDYHKKNYELYKLKLSKLDSTKQEYHMLKKSYETQMSESKYLFTILEKMKSPEIFEEENCSICMDQLNNPTLTACGHLFCHDCLKMCLTDNNRCPMCKTNLAGKDLLVMNLKVDKKEETNPLIRKYGSKLGKLISIIRFLVSQESTRIIIFSQWDDMLSLVGKTLADNGIENCFVKGNVWSRNSAINKFKAGKNNSGTDNKVIMLSLKNAASGTNLTEATHIFFVEPINATKEECRAIEGQAIARACRVGQKQKIMLMRVLIENTVEEEIYRKNYNSNVVVSFEEQSYLVEPIKPKTVHPEKDGAVETDSETPKEVLETTGTTETKKTKTIKVKKPRKSKEINL